MRPAGATRDHPSIYEAGNYRTCQEVSLGPDGLLEVEVSYELEGEASARTARATFGNPTGDGVVIVAR